MVDHYNKLVKLAARAFYDDLTSKGENQPKSGRSDNRGIAVVILDALTRRQWVREEDLAKDLKLHTKQLRRTLRFFEEEKIITREYRRETAKGAKLYSAATAATVDAQLTGKEGEEKVKLHTHSYCCLDYAQIYDVVRYRIHRMKKLLKDELDNKNTIEEYICTKCGKRYNALDALRLVSFEDDDFHCESCNGKLEVESDKFVVQEGADGDDNARRRRHEKLKDMLQKMEIQLKPLMDQLSRVKDLPVPEFGSLLAWEARASAMGRAANGDMAGDSKISQLGYNGAPMPYSGDTKVVVDFNGTEGNRHDVKSETESSSLKVLPPWMIKSGMVLTKEQRGEDEYIKAYYAALLKQQHEMEASRKQDLSDTFTENDPSSRASSIRQVGIKSKREEDDDDDGTDWEQAPVAGNFSFQGDLSTSWNSTGNENYKVNDLNVQADVAPADVDEDEDVDWEEG
ncbi:hypothetical protein V8G54_007707 [Vigna mungo]|uniref:HTH TFE/IIEalpha-type domain-containing protein n=1 Tax=Vigna mungo TaxID=3915 RepID=A0AAQ3P288_VIGMU